MSMKKLLVAVLLLCTFMVAAEAQPECAQQGTACDMMMTQHASKVDAVLQAVELYAEAGRQASRDIGREAFADGATMSWVENGAITTVPISSLYDVLEQTGVEEVTYKVEDVSMAGNVAFVRISSWFSKLGAFNDMFTLAEENGKWKIVSKIYSIKKP